MIVHDITNGQQVTSTSDTQKTQESADFSTYMKNGEKTLQQIFEQAAATYNVPVSLLEAVGMQESTFRADAVSKAGAQGIMQLMPATARELGVTDSFDAEQNIMGGAKYLSQLLNRFNGDTSLALAAYNAGANNVQKYGGIPPFQETQNYVEKVLGYMKNGVKLPDGTVTTGSSSDVSTGSSGRSFVVEEASTGTLSDILFSYSDYLKFIELYVDFMNEQEEKQDEEEEQNIFQKYAQFVRL